MCKVLGVTSARYSDKGSLHLIEEATIAIIPATRRVADFPSGKQTQKLRPKWERRMRWGSAAIAKKGKDRRDSDYLKKRLS